MWNGEVDIFSSCPLSMGQKGRRKRTGLIYWREREGEGGEREKALRTDRPLIPISPLLPPFSQDLINEANQLASSLRKESDVFPGKARNPTISQVSGTIVCRNTLQE